MAISPENQYPGQSNPSSLEYPQGSARNIVIPGDGLGTPWEEKMINDWLGFYQKLLDVAGISPSGSPDTVLASQYFQALTAIMSDRHSTVFATVAKMKAGEPVTGGAITYKFGQMLTVRDAANAEQQYRVVTVDTGIDIGSGFFAQIVLPYPSESPAVLGNMQVGYVGHRGAPLAAPENTAPAYEIAGKAGMWGAECDVQLTSDDAWVLMHDDTVDRTTDGTGLVSSFTLAGIKALDAGSWKSAYYTGTRVPTIAEHLFNCRQHNLVPIVEIKETGSYSDAQLQSLIDACLFQFPDRQFILATSALGILRQIRGLDVTVTLQYYKTTYSTAQIDIANQIGRCIFAPALVAIQAASDADVAYAAEHGVTLAVWTVNDPDDAETMVLKGVRLILTDHISLP